MSIMTHCQRSIRRTLLLALAFAAPLAKPAHAQNHTCPTAAIGDSSNKCASTAFVQETLAALQIIVGTTGIVGGTSGVPLFNSGGVVGNAGQVQIANGGTGQATAATAIAALMPTAVRAGDVAYWNGSSWTTLAGNNSGTQVFTESASGAPSWTSPGLGTVTEQKNTAGTGLATSGNCDNTTSNAGTPCQYALSTARQTLPTTQVFTTGTSQTYTTPANVLWLEIKMCGGGAGGAGSGSTGATLGSNGGDSTFSTFTAGHGVAPAAQTSSGAGGTATGGYLNQIGGNGGSGSGVATANPGGIGGASAYGGAGAGGAAGAGAGTAAVTNSCSGGGGGGVNSTANGGGGGGAGAYLEGIINSPTATYTYTVGSGGTGGTNGTGGAAGGNGAAGRITVIEHYGS